MAFLEEHNLLDDIQHGFRQDRSVISAVVAFLESVIGSIGMREHSLGIVMDLSKAFDSVPTFGVLVNKLNLLHIKGKTLD